MNLLYLSLLIIGMSILQNNMSAYSNKYNMMIMFIMTIMEVVDVFIEQCSPPS